MKAVPPETINSLCSYRWLGHVGELQNVTERAVILASVGIIHFDPTLKSSPRATTSLSGPEATCDEPDRQHILRALENKGWVIDATKDAARIHGLKPNTLRSKMKKAGNKRPTSSISLPSSTMARTVTRATRKAAASATSAPTS